MILSLSRDAHTGMLDTEEARGLMQAIKARMALTVTVGLTILALPSAALTGSALKM
jgi:hypothetical protein